MTELHRDINAVLVENLEADGSVAPRTLRRVAVAIAEAVVRMGGRSAEVSFRDIAALAVVAPLTAQRAVALLERFRLIAREAEPGLTTRYTWIGSQSVE